MLFKLLLTVIPKSGLMTVSVGICELISIPTALSPPLAMMFNFASSLPLIIILLSSILTPVTSLVIFLALIETFPLSLTVNSLSELSIPILSTLTISPLLKVISSFMVSVYSAANAVFAASTPPAKTHNKILERKFFFIKIPPPLLRGGGNYSSDSLFHFCAKRSSPPARFYTFIISYASGF